MTHPLPSKVGSDTAGVGVETLVETGEANERELGRKPNEQSVQSSYGLPLSEEFGRIYCMGNSRAIFFRSETLSL